MEKKFILIGVGGFGGEFWCGRFIPQFAGYARPVAAVDINPEAARRAAEVYGVVPPEKCYTDARRAIEENPCDFLAIVVPPDDRLPLIDLAVEFGLDVICEKPVADSMDHVCEIYRKMHDAGLKVVVTMSHRMERNKQSLQSLIRGGAYGRLNYLIGRLTMRRSRSGQRHVPADPDEMIRRMLSEGVIHELDTFRGMTGSNAKSVYAKVWKFDGGDAYGNSAFAQVEMENGVQCFVEHSHANATELNGWGKEFYRAECAQGTLVLDRDELTAYNQLGHPQPARAEVPLLDAGLRFEHPMLMHDFCQWLDGGPEPETSLRDNMQCCALTFAALQSARTGQAVDVQAFLADYLTRYGITL